jgi:hypothetical protein
LELMRERFAIHVCVLQNGMRAVLERAAAAKHNPHLNVSDLLANVPSAVAASIAAAPKRA